MVLHQLLFAARVVLSCCKHFADGMSLNLRCSNHATVLARCQRIALRRFCTQELKGRRACGMHAMCVAAMRPYMPHWLACYQQLNVVHSCIAHCTTCSSRWAARSFQRQSLQPAQVPGTSADLPSAASVCNSHDRCLVLM